MYLLKVKMFSTKHFLATSSIKKLLCISALYNSECFNRQNTVRKTLPKKYLPPTLTNQNIKQASKLIIKRQSSNISKLFIRKPLQLTATVYYYNK